MSSTTITNSATASITVASAAAAAVLPSSMKRQHPHRDDLGLERQVAAEQHQRAVLADRPRERQRRTGGDRRRQARQDDPAEDGQPAGAERRGGLLDVVVELLEHRLHGPHDERQGHERERQADRLLGVGPVQAERAVRAVEGEQHQAGDDRRQRERDVDDHVEHRLPQNRSRTRTQAMSVPITTLTPVTSERLADGELDARPGLRVGERVDVAGPAALGGGRDDRGSGISTSRLNQVTAMPSPSEEPGGQVSCRTPARRRGRRRAGCAASRLRSPAGVVTPGRPRRTPR